MLSKLHHRQSANSYRARHELDSVLSLRKSVNDENRTRGKKPEVGREKIFLVD